MCYTGLYSSARLIAWEIAAGFSTDLWFKPAIYLIKYKLLDFPKHIGKKFVVDYVYVTKHHPYLNCCDRESVATFVKFTFHNISIDALSYWTDFR